MDICGVKACKWFSSFNYHEFHSLVYILVFDSICFIFLHY